MHNLPYAAYTRLRQKDYLYFENEKIKFISSFETGRYRWNLLVSAFWGSRQIKKKKHNRTALQKYTIFSTLLYL